MKKILSIAAIFVATSLMLGSTAFGMCPLKAGQTACTVGNMTGAAAPVSYIVAPASQKVNMPSWNNNSAQPVKKNMFQRMMTPFTGVYNSIFGPFTNMYY